MREDAWRIVAVFIAALGLGLIFKQPIEALFLAFFVYSLWLHRKLFVLSRWIDNRKSCQPPDISGVLEEICGEVEYLRDRHKKRKKKLSGYLKQFIEATSALPDAVVVLGAYGEIEWANSPAEEFLGIHWPQDYRQRLTNLVRNPELPSFLMEINPEQKSIQISSPSKPDTYLSISVVPYGNSQRLFVARDVTGLHKLNQVRSDFVANVSHELRTPVTVISGYLEILDSSRDQLPDSWAQVLDQMSQQTLRMKSVIDDLLMLSRLEQNDKILTKEVVNIARLMVDLEDYAEGLNQNFGHDIIFSNEPNLNVIGSEKELFSAFSNLIVNAVRYTPPKGKVYVEWLSTTGGASFIVKDTGIGIPEQHIPRITERFYRVEQSRSRASGGTGLGLAIVKHVLKRHKAVLEIKSQLGEGSVFCCNFPENMLIIQHFDVVNS